MRLAALDDRTAVDGQITVQDSSLRTCCYGADRLYDYLPGTPSKESPKTWVWVHIFKNECFLLLSRNQVEKIIVILALFVSTCILQ